MKMIDENPFKFLSVKLPLWGSFIFGLLPIIIDKSMDTQLIPTEYHALIVSIVLPTLAFYGRMIYQPELHTNKAKRTRSKSNE